MSDDLLKHQEETLATVKPCPNCRKNHWVNTKMGEGHERLKCHECGLVLWGFSGLFTEEPAVAAWNLMSTRIEELEDKLDWVLVERDETFALMLDRAQTAEAKLAKAVEIAELFSGGVEYDYHGNIIGDEERKAMTELAELKGQSDE